MLGYEQNETMQMIGEAPVGILTSDEVRGQIYDVIASYNINHLQIIKFATDLFTLGYIHGRREQDV